MREISFEQVAAAVEWLTQRASTWLSPDIVMTIECAADGEEDPTARRALEDVLEWVSHSAETGTPLCQGKVLPLVTAEIGQEVHISGGTWEEALVSGVKSADLNAGEPVCHVHPVSGDRIALRVLLREPEEERNPYVAMLSSKKICNFELRASCVI